MRAVLVSFAAIALPIVLCGYTFFAVVTAAGRTEEAQAAASKPVPSSPASIKEGAQTYAIWCRSCHGLRGRGDGVAAPPGAKPANLVDADWKHGSTDALIFKNIKEGIAPFEHMKPQKGLTDTQVWNVVNYLRSLAAPVKK